MGGFLGIGGDDGGSDIPVKAAENVKRTAEPVKQLSDQARKNRRRLAGGAGDLGELKLATPGLLGIPTSGGL